MTPEMKATANRLFELLQDKCSDTQKYGLTLARDLGWLTDTDRFTDEMLPRLLPLLVDHLTPYWKVQYSSGGMAAGAVYMTPTTARAFRFGWWGYSVLLGFSINGTTLPWRTSPSAQRHELLKLHKRAQEYLHLGPHLDSFTPPGHLDQRRGPYHDYFLGNRYDGYVEKAELLRDTLLRMKTSTLIAEAQEALPPVPVPTPPPQWSSTLYDYSTQAPTVQKFTQTGRLMWKTPYTGTAP